MKNILSLISILTVIIISSCNENHLIQDEELLQQIRYDFEKRSKIYSGTDNNPFSIFHEENLNDMESEALMFLYAYMPLSDIADYSFGFFLENSRYSLKSIRETQWGDKIPDEIFLHYILPVRVNNENLDSFRLKHYDEIMDRIEGINSLENAALEINHWCHEKVSYQPADIRTSSPVATILSARGRCGEESTFTVAALRTAGIPARQIYTPRWAHSDDNHAWVEVWVNGAWKYLGACEPEPVLNRGWFTEPARRAMLTHTKAFGKYMGNENTVREEDRYAVINTLAHYARTKSISIIVFDKDNKPVKGAAVRPCLYNYAEFYPLAELRTDETGSVKFTTGLGDLLIWANLEEAFGFRKINVAGTETVEITLGNHNDIKDYYEFDIIPPLKRSPYPDTLSNELRRINKIRLAREDSIRNAYTNSWMEPEEVRELATSVNADPEILADIVERSMGNYGEITQLISSVPNDKLNLTIDLLNAVSDKDLRDTRAEVFYDHLEATIPYITEREYSYDYYVKYILNPRVANEIIKAWRSPLRDYFSEEQRNLFMEDPEKLADWIISNIRIKEEENYYDVPVTPEGVLRTGISDKQSGKILFIALCRTFGIPARLQAGTLLPEYYKDSEWNTVNLISREAKEDANAFLSLLYNAEGQAPEYYSHFTLARFLNGRYITLQYEYSKPASDFDNRIPLPPGKYMLVTGNRTDNSSVLSSIEFFDLVPGKTSQLEIKLRESTRPVESTGILDINLEFNTQEGKAKIEEYSDNGFSVIWIDNDMEPGQHIINDIHSMKDEFEDIGLQFILMTNNMGDKSVDKNIIDKMPENTILGKDDDMNILKSVLDGSTAGVQLPYVIYADHTGNIFLRSEGYRIGIGEQILKRIQKKE